MSERHPGESSTSARKTLTRPNAPSVNAVHRSTGGQVPRRSLSAKSARKTTFGWQLEETGPQNTSLQPRHQKQSNVATLEGSTITLAKKTGRKQGTAPRRPVPSGGPPLPTSNFTFLASTIPITSLSKRPVRAPASVPSNQKVPVITPSAPTHSPPRKASITKSSPITPHWLEADDQRAAELTRQRKDTTHKRADPIIRRWKYARKQTMGDEDADVENRPRTYLGRGLIVHRTDDRDVEMESTTDEDDSDGAPPAFHMVMKQTAIKSGARKVVLDEDVDMDVDEEEGQDENETSPEISEQEPPSTDDEEPTSGEEGGMTSSSDEVEIIEDDIVPRAQTVAPIDGLPSELLQAIKPFLPRLSRQNLPMKLRHLRFAFERKCIMRGVMTAKIVDEHVSFHVVYRRAVSTSIALGGATRQNNSYAVTFDSWKCPLCLFHGVFNTRQMLKSHLEWDHNAVEVLWDQGDEEHALRIILTFPEFAHSTNDHDLSDRPFIYARPIEVISSRETTPVPFTPEASETVELKPVIDELESQRTSLSAPPTSRSPSSAPSGTRSSSVAWSKIEARSPSPDSLRGSVPSSASRERSTTASTTTTITTTTASLDSTHTPPRIPRPVVSRIPRGRATQTNSPPFPDLPPPPPYEDRHGPAARKPYLPAQTPHFIVERNNEHGWDSHYLAHSCRPQGETLFDLLGVLPLAPFGVMSWAVLDREEEIFESDDMTDENKVICALWARWIFLNRRKFLADFEVGALDFIDEYCWMIYWAAGWRALRYLLLMLMANRFLKAEEVANVLKHYQRKIGMDFWYTDEYGSRNTAGAGP